MQLWDTLQPHLVIGENIGQTFHFVHSGNAELGFVALSQLRMLHVPDTQYWRVPSEQYASLEQGAALLHSSHDVEAARLFLEFMRGEAARRIIAHDGYGVQ